MKILATLAALSAGALSLVFTSSYAAAHATLETQQAIVGDSYKAVMRIPHGCGDKPTLKVRVRIPEGFIGVKPMPKAGWTLETITGKYDKPYQLFRAQLTEGVKEIDWTGKLPNQWYDEFVFVGSIASTLNPGATLFFPTVQECDGAAERWIELPEGPGAPEPKSPAPGLKLIPKP